MEEIRNIRDMDYRRRQYGLTVLERVTEVRLWSVVVALFAAASVIPHSPQKTIVIAVSLIVMSVAHGMREHIARLLDPIDRTHRDRGIASFSEEEAYRDLRFHLRDLPIMLEKLAFPRRMTVSNGLVVSGEYAMLLMMYRLHYPSTLAMLQTPFGRTYDELSRIFNMAIDHVYTLHGHKVRDVSWFSERFDLYNEAIQRKIAALPDNLHPGTVPTYVDDVFAFLDGHANEIARPWRRHNLQESFWNRYVDCLSNYS
jgi:hypothetical protein